MAGEVGPGSQARDVRRANGVGGGVLRRGDPLRAGRHHRWRQAGPQHAGDCVDAAGRFTEARFELEDEARTHWEEHSWAWHDNPFVGTSELMG
jgi:hypothetical protein